MSFLFGPKKPIAQQPTILQALRVSTSSYGQGMPIVYGQNRIPGKLIWYGDFTPIAHTSKTSSGGKGFGAGTTSTTSYTYQAAVAIALCEGPITQLCNVWETKGLIPLQLTFENFAIPGGGGSYQVTQHANFYAQIGVARIDSYSVVANDYGSDGSVVLSGFQNSPMSLVGSSPGAGQYTLNTGTATFGFSAADAGKTVTIFYLYAVPNSNSNGQPLQQLGLTLFTGSRPQTPWAYLTSNHPGQDLGYNGIAYVAASSRDLGSSGSLPNDNYEVLALLPFGGGITDAEPGAIVNDLLTNAFYGVGWSGALIGDFSNFSNYCKANSIFLSPVIDAQDTAATIIDDLIDLANGAAIWSEGVVKIKSYGDTTAVGNGTTFIPNTTPVYDLNDSSYIPKKNTDPVQIVRKSRADAFNDIKIEFVNRGNSYNVEIAEDKDDASIALYGLKADNPRQAHSICDSSVAKKVANIKRLRSVYIDGGNSYRFTLGWQYILLEPMDLVTLTDSNLGLNKHPVRITSIKENAAGELDFEAEEFPWGTAAPTAYPYPAFASYQPNQQADPGNVNTPLLFVATNRITGGAQPGYEIWMALSGASANWGGCNVWVSTDASTYRKIGTIHGAARMGVLTANLASHSDPDTVDTLSVNLAQSFGTLSSGASNDADNGRTACVILDGSGSFEIVSYQTATLTSAFHYNLSTYLRRGQFGSVIGAHSIGAQFARLDEAIFVYEYDPTLVGVTLHFKFTSFNTFELMEQSLANVLDYTLAVPSLGGATGVTAAADALGVRVSWNELVGSVPITSYNIYRNTTNTPSTATKIASLPSNGTGVQTFYDKSASVDTLYFYWITAVTAGSGIETAKSSVASSAGLAPGTHSSYRPTTNPLTATDAGASATISIASFPMQIGGLSVSYNSGAITSLSYRTIYYIYLTDSGFAGGSVTFNATTTKSNAINAYGQLFVGSILTPPAGGVQTTGNNDGGSGAQQGNTWILSPQLCNDSRVPTSGFVPIGTGGTTGAASAADGDTSTSWDFGTVGTLIYAGFPAFNVMWKSISLKILSSLTGAGGGTVAVDYSTDGGNTWTNVWSVTGAGGRALTTDAITLSATQNLNLVQIRFSASSLPPSHFKAFELWIEGQI